MQRYKSKYTGPQMEVAFERALPGGAIDLSLSNKANKDAPTEYVLPTSDGITASDSRYFKTDDNVVTVRISVRRTSAIPMNTQVATLPSGYRPGVWTQFCAVAEDGTVLSVSISMAGEVCIRNRNAPANNNIFGFTSFVAAS